MRSQVLCLDGIGRRSRVHREVVDYCSVTLLSLRPLRALRSPRSHAANGKRSLPQSAQSHGEKDVEPMKAQVLCSSAIGLRFRVHREVVECCSVTLLPLRPLRPLRSYAANDKRSLPQSAQSCGEKDAEPMRAEGLGSGAIGVVSGFIVRP